MWSKLFRKNRVKAANDSDFMKNWEALVKAQHDDMPRAGFEPIPELLLENSNEAYLSPTLKSYLIANMSRINSQFIFPIRALFNTN